MKDERVYYTGVYLLLGYPAGYGNLLGNFFFHSKLADGRNYTMAIFVVNILVNALLLKNFGY